MPAELCIEITQDEFPVDLGINADETLWVGSGQITGIRRKTRGGAIDKGIPFVKQDQADGRAVPQDPHFSAGVGCRNCGRSISGTFDPGHKLIICIDDPLKEVLSDFSAGGDLLVQDAEWNGHLGIQILRNLPELYRRAKQDVGGSNIVFRIELRLAVRIGTAADPDQSEAVSDFRLFQQGRRDICQSTLSGDKQRAGSSAEPPE